LQCVVVHCSVLQCIAVRPLLSMWAPALPLRYSSVAECCSVMQRIAVCRRALQCVAVHCTVMLRIAECCSVLQCVAVCCSVLQCVAVKPLLPSGLTHYHSGIPVLQSVTECCCVASSRMKVVCVYVCVNVCVCVCVCMCCLLMHKGCEQRLRGLASVCVGVCVSVFVCVCVFLSVCVVLRAQVVRPCIALAPAMGP